MADRDATIGKTIAMLRGDMTQQALADAMRKRGWKWSQSTVWSVEKGDRPLRLAEADDLAEIFDVPIDQLVLRPEVSAALERLRKAEDAVLDSLQRLEQATIDALVGSANLKQVATEIYAAKLFPEYPGTKELLSVQPEQWVRRARDLVAANRAGMRAGDHYLRQRGTDKLFPPDVITDQSDLGIPYRLGDRVVHTLREKNRTGESVGTVTKLVPPEEWPTGNRRSGPAVWVAFPDEEKERRIQVKHLRPATGEDETDDGVDRIEVGSDVLVESRGSGVTLAVNGTGADTTYTVQLYEGGQPIEVPHHEITRTVDSRRAAEEVRDGVDQASP